MHLDPNLWYVRLFFWSCRVNDQFWLTNHSRSINSRERRYRQSGTNLCQFFRTLFIGLIIALLTISTYVYLAFVVVVLPFILFPVTNIGTMIATILVIMIGLCAIIGSIIALVYGVNWSMEYLYHRNQANQGRPPGLFGLMIAYLMAVKQHFCPIIIFEQDDADGHA